MGNIETPKPKAFTKKKKGSVGLAQSNAAFGLYELKSTPNKTNKKPTTKKKGRDEGKGLVKLSTTVKGGKNVVGRDSKGDTMVFAMVETRVENTTIRRSSRLEKNSKKEKYK